jgi:hypothetical protein
MSADGESDIIPPHRHPSAVLGGHRRSGLLLRPLLTYYLSAGRARPPASTPERPRRTRPPVPPAGGVLAQPTGDDAGVHRAIRPGRALARRPDRAGIRPATKPAVDRADQAGHRPRSPASVEIQRPQAGGPPQLQLTLHSRCHPIHMLKHVIDLPRQNRTTSPASAVDLPRRCVAQERGHDMKRQKSHGSVPWLSRQARRLNRSYGDEAVMTDRPTAGLRRAQSA